MRPFRSSPSLTAVTDCITGPSWPHNRFAGVSGSSVLGPQLGLQRTVHLVQRAELLVLDDADLAVRPAHNPVTRVDRSLGLNDTVRQDGLHHRAETVVDVGLDRRGLVVAVLGVRVGAVRLVELGLTRAVDDVAVDVDGVPRADEVLLGTPLGVDHGLDALGHRD